MKKITTILIAIALIAMIGIVQANPFDGDFYNAAGNAPVPNPITLAPNVSQTFSFHAEKIVATANNTDLPYNYEVGIVSGSGVAGDITVTLPANFHPVTYDSIPSAGFNYTDIAAITIQMDANAPADTVYQVRIYAGSYNGSTYVDSGHAARNFEVPEFPTIALPIAAILGLAFIFQRRKEEE